MKAAPTISNRIVRRVTEAINAAGVDASALCLAVGLDPSAVQDLDGWSDVPAYLHLWGEAVVRTGDRAFPLRVVRAGSDMHDVLRFVAMMSRNMGEALERVSRYLRVLTHATAWPVAVGADAVTLTVTRTVEVLPGSMYADEYAIAEFVQAGRLFTGVDWAPREVLFTHGAGGDVRELEAFFRAPVHFDRGHTAVVLDRALLDLPMPKADPALAEFFVRYADDLIGRNSSAAPSLASRVRELLGQGMSDGKVTLAFVAPKLGMSARTLRRRLLDEGTTIQQLLDEVRCGLAKRYLDDGRVSAAEVAFLLGYAEPSAFYRAFRRWSGTTPEAWRRRAR